jgi:hypothetical protein
MSKLVRMITDGDPQHHGPYDAGAVLRGLEQMARLAMQTAGTQIPPAVSS